MFQIDEKLRGIPVTKEQVINLYQSVNQPHLAIPGKQPGGAVAFIVGVRLQTGLAVFIYLHLPTAGDCAVYATGRRNLTPEEYESEELDAMAFVESMGFMMDNMNFRGLPAGQQDELVKTQPVFMKDPKLAAPADKASPKKEEPSKPSPAALARLFSSL